MDICIHLSIRIHRDKTLIFARDIRWCARIIYATGWFFDPRNFAELQKMQLPTTGEHLQQFVCALLWMSTEIPKLALLISPLQDFLEKVYTKSGKRTKRAASRINLIATGWNDVQRRSFEACSDALQHQVKLSHRHESKRLCIFRDAGDICWSGIATQVPPVDLNFP